MTRIRMYLLASIVATTFAVITLSSVTYANAQEMRSRETVIVEMQERIRQNADDGIWERVLDSFRESDQIRNQNIQRDVRHPRAEDLLEELEGRDTDENTARQESRRRGPAIRFESNSEQEFHDEIRTRMQFHAPLSGTSTRQDWRASFQDRIEILQEMRERTRNHLREKATERAQDAAERMMRRFERALEHFSKLVERVESRLEKFEDRGVDTTEAHIAVTDARSAIAEAEIAVIEAHASIEALVFTDNPQEYFQSVRTYVRVAIEELRSTHRVVIAAVRSMGQLADELQQHNQIESDAATSTTQNHDDEDEDEIEDEQDDDTTTTTTSN